MFLKVISLIPLLIAVHAYFELQLYGGVLDNQYWTTVYIGTPPQPKNLFVDSGSSGISVNCQECTNCGEHIYPAFNRAASSSNKYVACLQQNAQCTECSNDSQECKYLNIYLDKTYTQGHVMEQLFSVTANSSSAVNVLIGCTNNASQQFATDHNINGMWGVIKGNPSVPLKYRTDKYIQEASALAGSPWSLSICLSFYGGKMVVGGVNNALHTRPPIIFSYDNESTDIMSKSLGRVKVGSKVIYQNGGQVMPDLIIDSGTTNSAVGKELYDEVIKSMEANCLRLGNKCKYLGAADAGEITKCMQLSDAYYLQSFDSITFTLAGQELLWRPNQFLVLSQADSNHFCTRIQPSNPTDGSHILGQSFMINKDVIYGLDNITIYPDSICGQRLPPYGQPVHALQSQLHSISGLSVGVIVGFVLAILVAFVLGVIVAKCWSKSEQSKNVEKQTAKTEVEAEAPPASDVRLGSQEQIGLPVAQ